MLSDWMAEEKDDFSPAVKAAIEEQLRVPETELEKAALRINRKFRKGGEAHEVLDDIRQFPKPIAVDFNNVIVNNTHPLQVNPEAKVFLEGLHEVGNVFIVTSAPGWEAVNDFLVEHGLWKPEMVLMTAPAYEFISQWQEDHPKGIELRREFVEMAKGLGWNYDEEEEDDLVRAPGYKAVAPIFGKPFEVPIIDDSYYATNNNPGMFGITVQAWETDEGMQRIYARSNQGKPSLAEAVEIVRSHYTSIGPHQSG